MEKFRASSNAQKIASMAFVNISVVLCTILPHFQASSWNHQIFRVVTSYLRSSSSLSWEISKFDGTLKSWPSMAILLLSATLSHQVTTHHVHILSLYFLSYSYTSAHYLQFAFWQQRILVQPLNACLLDWLIDRYLFPRNVHTYTSIVYTDKQRVSFVPKHICGIWWQPGKLQWVYHSWQPSVWFQHG